MPEQATPTTTEFPPCACKCGESTKSTKARFLQGHDAKLISKLAQDVVIGSGRGLNIIPKARANADIQVRIDEVTEYVRAKLSPALATKFHNAAMTLWANETGRTERAAAKAERASAKASKPARAKAAAKVAGPVAVAEVDPADDDNAPSASDVTETPAGGLGAPVRIRVGRYEYDGTVHGMSQAGKITAVQYTNKAGNSKVATSGFRVI
jgi:hypothetical protein